MGLVERAPLYRRVTETVSDGTLSPGLARAKVERLVRGAFAREVVSSDFSTAGIVPTPEAAEMAAALTERRLHMTSRALKREASQRGDPMAVQMLANHLVRGTVELVGWRKLAEMSTSSNEQAVAKALASLLGTPNQHRGIAAIAFAASARASESPAAQPFSHQEKAALAEILATRDPLHGTAIREALASGQSLEPLRGMMFQRLVPLHAESAKPSEKKDNKKAETAGLTFDFAINRWVPKERSWSYPITLEQLFDYEVDGIVDGERDLAKRLISATSDPLGGAPVVTPERLEEFVKLLAKCRESQNPRLRALLAAPFELAFSTTDGGSTPLGVQWELPVELAAELVAAMHQPELLAELSKAAAESDRKQIERTQKLRAPLADLLHQYDGTPKRHRRAHAALINLGLAKQSLRELGADGGILPKSQHQLTPEILRTRFANAHELKVRFLFTDEFDCYVLDDKTFAEVVAKHGFPPNHELLSYNRPIAASGYLTIEKGKVVGVECDTEMLPGKLPARLPPTIELLRKQGFALDEARIQAAAAVVDFKKFRELSQKGTDVAPLTGTLEEVREQLAKARHADRPALIVATLKAKWHERKDLADTAAFASGILKNFRIINSETADFQNGNLPSSHNEFSELTVDQEVARHLARLVAR